MTDPSRLHVRSPSVPRRHSAHEHSGGKTVPAQSRPIRSLRQSASQDLGEYDRVIVFGVPRRLDEGERAATRPLPELREPRALVTKLFDIAATKLLKTTRIVPKPLSEFRARRQLSLPLIELGPLA
jgi:hypothetical protein